MAVTTITATGYQPAGTAYINPTVPVVDDGSGRYYVIRLDTDGEPYYTAL